MIKFPVAVLWLFLVALGMILLPQQISVVAVLIKELIQGYFSIPILEGPEKGHTQWAKLHQKCWV